MQTKKISMRTINSLCKFYASIEKYSHNECKYVITTVFACEVMH